jgi:hypothetical protein
VDAEQLRTLAEEQRQFMEEMHQTSGDMQTTVEALIEIGAETVQKIV